MGSGLDLSGGAARKAESESKDERSKHDGTPNFEVRRVYTRAGRLAYSHCSFACEHPLPYDKMTAEETDLATPMNCISRCWRRCFPVVLALGLCAQIAFAGPQAQDARPAPIAQGQPLDINTATAAELKTLPGMGDAYVKRIIDGRPYTAKNQLATRGILPQAAYERIRDLIVAHRLPRTY